MPSFFFHIAIDVVNDPNNCPPYGLTWTNIFQSSTKKRISGNLVPIAPDQLKNISGSSSKAGESGGGIVCEYSGLDSQDNQIKTLGHCQQDSTEIQTGAKGKRDWRSGDISLQSIDMLPHVTGSGHEHSADLNGHVTNGIGAGPGGLSTKGRFEPTDLEEEGLGWGVVRLYRDAEETPGLYDDVKSSKYGKGSLRHDDSIRKQAFRDKDCTTLCIPAVPSYLTPSDFLGFVGEKTREEVSHFRMIRTERVNRYMVLMKFRSGKKAREWRKEWNGKVFNSTEPENCHVVFVKSIKFRMLEDVGREISFPDLTNDPFTPSKAKSDGQKPLSPTTQPSALASTPLSTKPMAPPTPSLVELPTCPVCLERMDESTGLLTILCQHVFHCSCLQKWRGSGCPVCRYTQNELGRRNYGSEAEVGLNECNTCRSDANLWMCLICGSVGCGRYDAAHAFQHYQDSSHCFAMDLTTQRVWDYASDGYVHRIVQNKTDGKLVELPSANHNSLPLDDITEDYLPREKLDSIGLEYTHLLTSQLDSQRLYFEEKVERAADKASQAALAATSATEAASMALTRLAELQRVHENVMKDMVPVLERDRERAVRKAEKFEEKARKLEKEWREEKALAGSLMERVRSLGSEVQKLKEDNEELKEQNRDLGFFISGGEKLREAGLGDELTEGTVSLHEGEKINGGKKKGKGKVKSGGL